MKKIINNKVYDTETAVYIGTASYSHPGDFHHWEESLYRKRTGEFFLHGEGGAMTRYAVQVETNSWTGGEKIIPMTYQQAREWAEDHLEADNYIEVFGTPQEEDDGKEQILLRLSNSAARKLRQMCSETGKPMADLVSQMIDAATK